MAMLQNQVESHNGIFDCQAARDFLIYATSGSRDNLSIFLEILKETTLQPIIQEEDLEMAKKSIVNENTAMHLTPPPDNLIADLTHITAFGSRGLGNPRYCPLENLDKITLDDVRNYLGQLYRPENFYIVGVGIEHEQMINSVRETFLPWSTTFDEISTFIQTEYPSTYTGGVKTNYLDLTQYHSPMPEFGHVCLSFKSDGTVNIDDHVKMCLFTSFMGGGGSFSSGGPGKGMYSRLYTNFLNRHHWVNSAQALNTAFSDVSLFSISGSAFPQDLNVLVSSMIIELQNILHNGMERDELARAKTQLISLILMNLEMKPVVFEDFARQLVNNGTPIEPDFWVEKIKTVSEEDLRGYLKRIMTTEKATLVGFGKCENFIDEVELGKCVKAAVDNNFVRKYVPNFLKKYL